MFNFTMSHNTYLTNSNSNTHFESVSQIKLIMSEKSLEFIHKTKFIPFQLLERMLSLSCQVFSQIWVALWEFESLISLCRSGKKQSQNHIQVEPKILQEGGGGAKTFLITYFDLIRTSDF